MKELIKKYWYVVVVILCIVSLYFVVNEEKDTEFELEKFEETVVLEKEDSSEVIEVTNYYVDIKGEVVSPGVYEVSPNSRIIDVINKAGGLTKNADTSLLNLSKKVTDEMNIKIYSKTEVKTAKENLVKEPEVIEIIKEVEKECICPENNEVCSDGSTKNDALIEDNSSLNVDNVESNKNSETIDKIDSNSDDKENNIVNINTATKEDLMTIPNIGESKADKIIEYRNKNKFNSIEDIKNVSGIGDSIFEKIKNYITV